MSKAKLGSGARFKAVSKSIQKKGKSKKAADAIAAKRRWLKWQLRAVRKNNYG
jgi:hypothetical protein